MLSIVNSCAFLGVNGYLVKVEVDVSAGLPGFEIVGLPDATVRESKERVRAALRNSGFEFPLRRITVNLAPANIKKAGALFDFPIAIGILSATDQLPMLNLNNCAFIGELSLEGSLRPIPGAVVMSACLSEIDGINQLYLPEDNSAEAALIEAINVFGISSLGNFYAIMNNKEERQAITVNIEDYFNASIIDNKYDMAEVRGQDSAKRVLEIAAAGGHNVLLMGPPGSGKTMLARRLSGILPPLTISESLEITKLYSISGLLPANTPLIAVRPFRSPHHGASGASIIGGGASPKPGEISLASGGVLFMDELPEFSKDVLEALRQPLEDRNVVVSRVSGRVEYPAEFQLIGALNPCPCGYYGDSLNQCKCTPHMIEKYLNHISGPLMDRIDLQIEVPRVKYNELSENIRSESSEHIRKRVIAARKRQSERFIDQDLFCNAQMSRRDIEKYCVLDKDGKSLMEDAFRKLRLSARAHDRLLKVARTIADLSEAACVQLEHIAEAIQYRATSIRN